MITNRAIYGLNAILLIALAQRHQPIAASRLSTMLGLSISCIESLMKNLKDGDLVRSYRGPGGGYQLQKAVVNLSVWDVVSCFKLDDDDTKHSHFSLEFMASHELHQQVNRMQRKFLQDYPLATALKLVAQSYTDIDDIHNSTLSLNFKPMKKEILPMAPNSVFDLANFCG